MTGGQNIAVCD